MIAMDIPKIGAHGNFTLYVNYQCTLYWNLCVL